jgi:hypothetical protein
MNIRQAILKAADHIERNPHLFDFKVWLMPNDCGTPGCAIGWIGLFSGKTFEKGCWDIDGPRPGVSANVCQPALGINAEEFYSRMDCIDLQTAFEMRWRRNAENCARTLRLYADTYHPAESRALIPASVRAIFTMTPEQLRAEFERA